MNIALSKMTNENYREICFRSDIPDNELEFLDDFKRNKGEFYVIERDKRSVGVAQIKNGQRGFVYIYIEPSYRNQGIATRTYELCERQMNANEVTTIGTSYNTNNIISKHFAEKNGFERKFESTNMKYSGDKYHINSLPIREYCDDDYHVSHELYAKAFHEMRVHVGDFPESVIELPSEDQKKFWSDTSNQRFVYVKDTNIIALARVVENEISSISVKSEHQGNGVGRNFMMYICNHILSMNHNTVSLWCVVGNRAKSLYDNLGFVESFTAEFAEKN